MGVRCGQRDDGRVHPSQPLCRRMGCWRVHFHSRHARLLFGTYLLLKMDAKCPMVFFPNNRASLGRQCRRFLPDGPLPVNVVSCRRLPMQVHQFCDVFQTPWFQQCAMMFRKFSRHPVDLFPVRSAHRFGLYGRLAFGFLCFWSALRWLVYRVGVAVQQWTRQSSVYFSRRTDLHCEVVASGQYWICCKNLLNLKHCCNMHFISFQNRNPVWKTCPGNTFCAHRPSGLSLWPISATTGASTHWWPLCPPTIVVCRASISKRFGFQSLLCESGWWFIDTIQNGTLSALPYLVQFVVHVSAGRLADTLRVKFNLKTVHVRKAFDCLGNN